MRLVTRLLVAAVSGVTINAAFPDFNVWPLAFVGVALLWWSLDGLRAWPAFFVGWACGVAFLAPHVWWAYVSVGLAPWLALTLVEGIAWGLVGAAWAHICRAGLLDRHVWLDAPVFALMWVGAEQIRSAVPFGGFPWGRIGFSQLDGPLARFAYLGGVPFVSFVTVALGVWLVTGLLALKERRLVEATLAPATGVVVLLSGWLVPLSAHPTPDTLWVGAVQGNLPDLGLDAFAQARLVTTNHRDGTLALMERDDVDTLDIVVWPENAVDIDPRVDAESNRMVRESLEATGAPLFLGVIDYSPDDARYNSQLLVSPAGEEWGHYNKQQPAPFAEYVPIRDVARIFSDAVELVRTDMIGGDEPGVVTLPSDRLGRDVHLGVVICFEVAYDWIVADSIQSGAEVLFVPTNNANFGRTAESTQQLAMSRMRAIETGRATIQISTVGVSGVILPTGEIVERTGLFTAEQMYVEVPLRTDITPAVRWQTWIEWIALLAPMGIVGWAATRRMREAYEW